MAYTGTDLNKAERGWVKSRSAINVLDYGAVGDGVTDDRASLQSVFDSASSGDIIIIPKGTYKIINATGSGGTTVEQRADAVANSTLYAITCSVDNLTVIIDGDIVATSALDNVFKFTGDNINIKGIGKISNTSGVFVDINSSDELLQWHPSLISFTGDNIDCSGLTFVDQPTVSIMCAGSNCNIHHNVFRGGLLTHTVTGASSYTVQFYVYLVQTGASNIVTNNQFLGSPTGGSPCSSVFNVSARSIISNNVMTEPLEHSIYNYGAYTIMSNNQMYGHTTETTYKGACISCYANNCVMDGNISYDSPGIALQGYNAKITNNHLDKGSISVRKYTGDATSSNYSNILIAGNSCIDVDTLSYPIDVNLECNLSGLVIENNYVTGGITGVLSSSIRAAVFNNTYTCEGIVINANHGECDGRYAIRTDWATDVNIFQNKFSGYTVSEFDNANSTNVVIDGVEMGTFTPAWSPATGTITMHTSYASLFYVKRGRQVTISGTIVASSVSTPNGALKITGLPYAASNLSHQAGASTLTVYSSGLEVAAPSNLMASISEGTTEILLAAFYNGSPSNAGSYIKANSAITISGTYLTD